jgi:hypothetical protein
MPFFPLSPGRDGNLCSTSSVVAFSCSFYFAIRINEPINAAATTITANTPAIEVSGKSKQFIVHQRPTVFKKQLSDQALLTYISPSAIALKVIDMLVTVRWVVLRAKRIQGQVEVVSANGFLDR